MPSPIAEIASRLSENAEAVCRHYLPSGCRSGNYWIIGDVFGSPGRSTFIRLSNLSGRAAGRWMDAASGEHGDLLDLIQAKMALSSASEAIDEARRFLSLPRTTLHDERVTSRRASSGSPENARRLVAASQPIAGTLAARYLRFREIDFLGETQCLRFHPRCYYRPDDGGPMQPWPAMIAAVTDLSGAIRGVHRTWLARDLCPGHPTLGKAPFTTPRRAMGQLLGHAVRFGQGRDTLLAGEGIETVLSLRCLMPRFPAAAALSTGHLGAIAMPIALRRLYIAREPDLGSDVAFARLSEQGRSAGIDVVGLLPTLKDFNDDLRLLGADAVRGSLFSQLRPEDACRFLG